MLCLMLAEISEAPSAPELTTVPLQSQPNASPFWIMLLLSFGEERMELPGRTLPEIP
jgi:hypothetical protein